MKWPVSPTKLAAHCGKPYFIIQVENAKQQLQPDEQGQRNGWHAANPAPKALVGEQQDVERHRGGEQQVEMNSNVEMRGAASVSISGLCRTTAPTTS